MPAIDPVIVQGHLNVALDAAATTSQRGKALEDLVAYVFSLVPGIAVTHRNDMNVFSTEEIDVGVFNDQAADGFPFLPTLILIECKNWSNAVSSNEVSWFLEKLRSRGLDFGILVATNGITGNAADLTAAHVLVARALMERRRLVLISVDEIQGLADTDSLILMIKRKLCDLIVKGTVV